MSNELLLRIKDKIKAWLKSKKTASTNRKIFNKEIELILKDVKRSKTIDELLNNFDLDNK